MNPKIDISENSLRHRGRVLGILLQDKTTRRNIIWATDSYVGRGKDYAPKKQIKREQITGVNGKLIQPRAAKSREEQKYRTKDKAEVFTPLKIVKKMNTAILHGLDLPKDYTWQDSVATKWLEITCGEAPFIASRYDPTANTGKVIPTAKRVGFLDMKLQSVNTNTKSKKDWLHYAEIALKSSYGYEWQGDNLLIARENILQTVNDFYQDFCKNKLKLKSHQSLNDEQLEKFAEIIAWNIWQMDGLKCTMPMSNHPEPSRDLVNKNQIALNLDFGYKKSNKMHTSPMRVKYAMIKDWSRGKNGIKIKFAELVNSDNS